MHASQTKSSYVSRRFRPFNCTYKAHHNEEVTIEMLQVEFEKFKQLETTTEQLEFVKYRKTPTSPEEGGADGDDKSSPPEGKAAFSTDIEKKNDDHPSIEQRLEELFAPQRTPTRPATLKAPKKRPSSPPHSQENHEVPRDRPSPIRLPSKRPEAVRKNPTSSRSRRPTYDSRPPRVVHRQSTHQKVQRPRRWSPSHLKSRSFPTLCIPLPILLVVKQIMNPGKVDSTNPNHYVDYIILNGLIVTLISNNTIIANYTGAGQSPALPAVDIRRLRRHLYRRLPLFLTEQKLSEEIGRLSLNEDRFEVRYSGQMGKLFTLRDFNVGERLLGYRGIIEMQEEASAGDDFFTLDELELLAEAATQGTLYSHRVPTIIQTAATYYRSDLMRQLQKQKEEAMQLNRGISDSLASLCRPRQISTVAEIDDLGKSPEIIVIDDDDVDQDDVEQETPQAGESEASEISQTMDSSSAFSEASKGQKAFQEPTADQASQISTSLSDTHAVGSNLSGTADPSQTSHEAGDAVGNACEKPNPAATAAVELQPVANGREHQASQEQQASPEHVVTKPSAAAVVQESREPRTSSRIQFGYWKCQKRGCGHKDIVIAWGKDELKRHIGNHHKSGTCRCCIEGCSRIMNRPSAFREHLMKSHKLTVDELSPEQNRRLMDTEKAYYDKWELDVNRYFPPEAFIRHIWDPRPLPAKVRMRAGEQ
ncbi:hypothetical protein QR680_012039 [Steinernema hermaphroditum]|uniref:C2H2-type domain-containing protein n=1 Tax=Steinernema hermaphroditum TaxID=289476 RepID=A0AA39I298_9BILA|nr:hypothetical protein QR680_012039 [Steinernema hermaphroditum]